MRNLGQTKDQRLDLQPREHLRRQGGVFGQGVASPRLAVDQGARGAQGLDVAVERAFGHAGFFGQPGGSDRLGQHPEGGQKAEQAVGSGHGILTGSDRRARRRTGHGYATGEKDADHPVSFPAKPVLGHRRP